MCESECALRCTLGSGRPVIGRACYIIDAEGGRIPISISTAVLRDSNGQVIGGAETFRDLSESESRTWEIFPGPFSFSAINHPHTIPHKPGVFPR